MAYSEPIKCMSGVIALEGLDGCGTTTQAQRLSSRLVSEGFPSIQTQEPSSGPVGKLIREALTATESKDADTFPAFLALLFAADRLEHLERCIRPAVEKGEWVVSDRSVLSSLAYQSLELPSDWVASINSFAPYPHLIFWLDTPVDQCLARIQGRAESRERYEKRETLERLKPLYESLFRAGVPGVEFLRVHGGQSVDAVHEEIWDQLKAWMQRKD